jgi:hypothetical protein
LPPPQPQLVEDLVLPVQAPNAAYHDHHKPTRSMSAVASQAVNAQEPTPAERQPPARVTPPPESRTSGDHQVRVRTGDGQVLGPVSVRNLESLARAQAVRRGDLVSVEGAPFRPIEEVSSLREVVQLPADPVPAVPTQTGPISQLGMPKLIYLLSTRRLSGRLKLTRASVTKDIYFRKGKPIHISSNQKSELLGTFLVAKGYVSQMDLDVALERSAAGRGRIGDVLMAMNIIKPGELFAILQKQFQEKFIEVFSWEGGHYAFYEGLAPPGDVVPLDINPMPLLTEGIREKLPLSVLEPFLSDLLDRPYLFVKNPHITTESLRFNPRETRVLTAIQSSRKLREAQDRVGPTRMLRLSTLQVMFALFQFELIQFEGRAQTL